MNLTGNTLRLRRDASLYALATLMVLATVSVRIALEPWLGEQAPFMLFVLAIMVAAWRGGLGPGLLATALSLVIGRYYFVEPRFDLRVDGSSAARLVLFAVAGTAISFLCGRMHRVRASLETEIARARESEAARRESAHQLTLATDALPALVSYVTPDYRYRFVNATYGEWFGCDPASLIGKNLVETIGPELLAERMSRIQEALAGKRTEFEARIPHVTRGLIDCHIAYLPDIGEDGKVQGFYVFVNDIGERKRIELELARREEQLRQMADALPQFAWIASADGRVQWFNRRWYDYTGATPEASIGAGWIGCMHPDDVEPMVIGWQHSLATGAMFEQEHRVRNVAGDYRWFLARGLPIHHEDGSVRQWFGSCTDIQDMLDARRSAEAASIAKSEFLANMSHEIRTPMNAIVGLAAILSSRLTLEAKDRRFLETLQHSADSMLLLINQILDFAKIESSKIDLETAPFSPKELLEVCAGILSVEAEAKGLRFDRRFDDLRDVTLEGDALRIRQIVMNLLGNAVKFTSTGAVSLSAAYAFGKLVVRVEDTGIGMDEPTRRKIFDKFTQADASMTRQFGGTGLGLAISRSLAELMEGTIEVESTPGTGSRFTLTVPLAEIAAPRQVAAPRRTGRIEPVAFDSSRPRLLVIEDNEANVLVATSMLEIMGYGFDVARSGQEALKKIETNQYGLILMDVQMHGMDGCETTHFIRLREDSAHWPRTPIIAMTAHAMSGDRERCLGAGMDDYIPKPFSPVQLQDKIATYIRHPS